MSKKAPCGGLQPEIITDFIAWRAQDKDWSNQDCLRCQWHPQNNTYSKDHPTKPNQPAYGHKDLSVCANPGIICGKYSPPWKPEIKAKNLAAINRFSETLS